MGGGLSVVYAKENDTGNAHNYGGEIEDGASSASKPLPNQDSAEREHGRQS